MRVLNGLKRNPWQLCLAAGAAVGLIAFACVYGLAIVNPTYWEWLYQAHMDPQGHHLGWMALRNAEWRFPLLTTSQLTWPYYTASIFTDSIPGMALLFKLLSPVLPANFQYFGLWGLLCYLLQGGLAALTARKIKNSLPFCLGAAALFCTAPVLMMRLFDHTALGGQWLMLLAICCWAYLDHLEPFKKLLAVGMALPVLAVLVHQYLVVMVYGLLVGILANHGLRYRFSWRQPAVLGASLASGLLTLFVFGGFSLKSAGFSTGGFGDFGANLNALYNPYGFSQRLTTLPYALDGQYEGLGYLGLGVLFLGFIAAGLGIARLWKAAAHKQLKPFLLAHQRVWVMAAVGFIFFAAALLPAVSLDEQILFNVPLGPLRRLFEIFRCNGRLLWPTVYLVMFGVLYLLARGAGRRFGLLVLAMAVLLQVNDLAPMFELKARDYRAGQVYESEMENLELIAGDGYRLVMLMDGGIATFSNPEPFPIFGLGHYALKNGLAISDGFVPRKERALVNEYREQTMAELEAGRFEDDVIYVFRDESPLPQTGLHYYHLGQNIIVGLPRPTNALPAI